MKIEVGTLKSKIITDNPDVYTSLYKRFAVDVPGAEYTKAFRKRHWDGKKRFVSRNGIFRSGLLTEILNVCEEAGLEVELDFGRPLCPMGVEVKSVDKFSYRDYQEKAIINAILCERQVIKAPTGSGKTLIMAGLLKTINPVKSIFLFNQKHLARQTYEFFKSVGIEDVGICTGEGYVYGSHMICTVQSIDKVLDTHLDSTLLAVDECHEFCNGDTTLDAIESFPEAFYRFGFTATPPKEKSLSYYNLVGALGPIEEYADTQDLIREGRLSKPIIQVIDYDDGTEDSEDMSYPEAYETYIITSELRNKIIKEICEFIESKNKNSKTLILVKNLEHVQILKDLIPNSLTIEGKHSLTERYTTIDSFINAPWSSIMIATKVLQTGISIDEITHFVNARGLKSDIATIQALGRSMRRPEGQDRVYVYDFVDRYKYLYDHSISRQGAYEKEGHEVVWIEW